MAVDNSPPRLRPILITAAVAVVILVGLKFVFDSYYIEMFEAEEYVKVGSVKPAELIALREAEKKSLANAPIPIDKAMAMVVRGRADPMPDLPHGGITPEQSTDNAPLIGWAQIAHSSSGGSPSASPPKPPASASAPPAGTPAPATSASSAASAPSPPGSAPAVASANRPPRPPPGPAPHP